MVEPAGIGGCKLDTPQSDRLITNSDAFLCQQVFDVTVSQVEPAINPNRVANDAGEIDIVCKYSSTNHLN